jgi:hypothetical protein
MQDVVPFTPRASGGLERPQTTGRKGTSLREVADSLCQSVFFHKMNFSFFFKLAKSCLITNGQD